MGPPCSTAGDELTTISNTRDSEFFDEAFAEEENAK